MADPLTLIRTTVCSTSPIILVRQAGAIWAARAVLSGSAVTAAAPPAI
jgi:hypothetical protein